MYDVTNDKMQFEPNWLDSFILKWSIHKKKGENYIRWIVETNFNIQEEETKSTTTGSNMKFFLGNFHSDAVQELLAICCLALDNSLPVACRSFTYSYKFWVIFIQMLCKNY